MMKKEIALLSLCFLSGVSAMEGFYVGGHLGGSASSITFSDYLPTNLAAGVKDSAHAGIFKPVLGMFAGYNRKLNSCAYGGVEAFLDGVLGGETNIHSRDRANSAVLTYLLTHTLQRKGVGFGLLARMGFMVSEKTGLFLGLGFKSTAWRLNSQDLRHSVTATKSDRSIKFHMQAGAEGLMSSHFGWRVAYSLTPGKNVKISTFPAEHELNLSGAFVQTKATEHTITAGVFYKF